MPGSNQRGAGVWLAVCAAGVLAMAVGVMPGVSGAAEKKAPDWDAQQKALQLRKQQELKRQTKQMEELREGNPEGYRNMKRIRDRQAAIQEIVSAHQAGKLETAAARRKLTPLIEEQVHDELSTADQRISSMQQAIEDLQAMKANAKTWVKEQVDHWLQVGMPVEPAAAPPEPPAGEKKSR